MKMKNLTLKPLFLLLLPAVLLGCQSSRTNTLSTIESPPVMTQRLPSTTREQAAQPKVRVAMLLPMSGDNAQLGQSLMQAAQLSLFDSGDSNLELTFHDTNSNPGQAQQVAREAVRNGAQLIIGPVFSDETKAIAQAIDSANTPIVSFSNDQEAASRNVFTFGFSPRDQIDRVLTVAAQNNVRKIGILLPNTSYGRKLEQMVNQHATQSGIQIALTTYYNTRDIDFSTQAQQIKDSAIEGLFIPEGGKTLRHLASSLLYHDVDLANIRLLGTGQWDTEDIKSSTGLTGGWFAAPNPKSRQKFEGKYRDQFGQTPPRIATLAYDAIALASILARKSPDRPFTNNALTQSRGFAGIDGVFRLYPDGRTRRNLAVFEVAQNGLRTISPATQTF